MASNSSNGSGRRRTATRNQMPISAEHYAAVLEGLEAPFTRERLDQIRSGLVARVEQAGQTVEQRSLEAKVFLGQELKLREVLHHSRPLRPTETTVRGGLPSVEDVLNEKRAWLEADARRYWDTNERTGKY